MSVELKIQYLPHYSKDWDRIHYKHADDSGFDLRAAVAEKIILKAHEIRLIPCGIKIEMSHEPVTPYFYELQIRARSGLASKFGIGVANGPGTVDYGYRGEIMVPLINFSDRDFEIMPGDRIAQGIICPVIQAKITAVETVCENSARGQGGFGSTGCK